MSSWLRAKWVPGVDSIEASKYDGGDTESPPEVTFDGPPPPAVSGEPSNQLNWLYGSVVIIQGLTNIFTKCLNCSVRA